MACRAGQVEDKRSERSENPSTADEQFPKVMTLRNRKKQSSKDQTHDLKAASGPSADPSSVGRNVIGNGLNGKVAVRKSFLRDTGRQASDMPNYIRTGPKIKENRSWRSNCHQYVRRRL